MRKMRTLVVDDDPVSKYKMNLIMQRYGSVEVLETGEEAVDAFLTGWVTWRPYDLIMLDFNLPDITGIDVLLRIRNMEEEKGVPREDRVKILIVSARTDKGSIAEGITAGCDDYVIKPFERDIIEEKLEKFGLM